MCGAKTEHFFRQLKAIFCVDCFFLNLHIKMIMLRTAFYLQQNAFSRLQLARKKLSCRPHARARLPSRFCGRAKNQCCRLLATRRGRQRKNLRHYTSERA